eukprot:10191227-Ditylum_brightwellii.AAC.2
MDLPSFSTCLNMDIKSASQLCVPPKILKRDFKKIQPCRLTFKSYYDCNLAFQGCLSKLTYKVGS